MPKRRLTPWLDDVWLIENARSTVGSELRSILPTATSVDIATAFVTNNGLDSILDPLRKASYSGPVRIITGIKDNFTDPSALRRLLTVSRERGEAFKVKVSRDPRFHWKVYYIVIGSKATVILGSSNLTADGLGASGELNIAVSVPVMGTEFRNLHKPFEKEWTRAAARGDDWVKLYEACRLVYPPRRVPTRSTSKLLGMKPSTRERVHMDVLHGILYCEGYFSRATAKIIEATTNWDDEGWDCLSVGPRVEKGQQMIFFDFNSHVAYLGEVKDTETTRRTKDGRHFAAIEQLPKTRRRRISNSLRRELKNHRLIQTWADAKVQRFISTDRWQRFAALFTK